EQVASAPVARVGNTAAECVHLRITAFCESVVLHVVCDANDYSWCAAAEMRARQQSLSNGIFTGKQPVGHQPAQNHLPLSSPPVRIPRCCSSILVKLRNKSAAPDRRMMLMAICAVTMLRLKKA